MNSWKIKQAYKKRTFPPLNSREKRQREIAIPFIELKRTIKAIPKILSEYSKKLSHDISNAYAELKPYFGRSEE